MAQIDIHKADVLAALYNNSRPQGMGSLHFDPTPMTTEEARKLCESGQDDLAARFGNGIRQKPTLYFDYLKGSVLKVDLTGDTFESHSYDRDLGPGAAERALSTLKAAATRAA